MAHIREALLASESEHQLHTHGLKEFVPYILNSTELIHRLYMEKSEAALNSKGRVYVCCLIKWVRAYFTELLTF